MVSAWSGIGITYNRKTAGVYNIEHPLINIIGGAQPALLSELAADSRGENGLLARFCPVYPDNTKKARYSTAVIPEELIDEWEQFLAKLTNMTETVKLKLSQEAQQVYAKWFDENADKADAEPTGYIKGIYGKLDIIALDWL